MVPLLVEGPVLALTEYLTNPLPLPFPEVTLIKPSLLTAVQAHPPGAVTAKLASPPLRVNAALPGESASVHCDRSSNRCRKQFLGGGECRRGPELLQRVMFRHRPP